MCILVGKCHVRRNEKNVGLCLERPESENSGLWRGASGLEREKVGLWRGLQREIGGLRGCILARCNPGALAGAGRSKPTLGGDETA